MKLKEPGCGLPPLEKFFIKTFLVPSVKFLFTWESALNCFNKEAKKIEMLLKNIPQDDLQKRVLIDRIFGIEDNSRDFSINLVLEHLVIVGNGMIELIQTLSNEQAFTQEITIAGVKPYANNANTLETFVKLVETYNAFIESLPKKKSLMTKRHPWFVEFNNFEWSVFMFIHTWVHRRQIASICKNLYM